MSLFTLRRDYSTLYDSKLIESAEASTYRNLLSAYKKGERRMLKDYYILFITM
jgi:hypothetical protein